MDSSSTPLDKEFKPPSGPRGLDIRGNSTSKGAGAALSGGKAAAPTKDPHTLDREARDRERLLKEAQRITRLAGLAGSKRSRGGDDEGEGNGRKSRRASRRSETVDGDDESRLQRLEAERERGRWD